MTAPGVDYDQPATLHNASNRDYERVWTAPLDCALAELLDAHRYDGGCPDAVNGWYSRDPACEACALLDRIVNVGVWPQ